MAFREMSCNLFVGKILDAQFSDDYTEIGQSGTIPSDQGQKASFVPHLFLAAPRRMLGRHIFI